MLASSPNLLSFTLGSTFDTLASPSNLKSFRISTKSHYILCNKPICTTAHILSGYNVALLQGRYTVRHDSVLKKLCSVLKVFIKSASCIRSPTSCHINFVKEGSVPKKTVKKSFGILHWQMIGKCTVIWTGNIFFLSGCCHKPQTWHRNIFQVNKEGHFDWAHLSLRGKHSGKTFCQGAKIWIPLRSHCQRWLGSKFLCSGGWG